MSQNAAQLIHQFVDANGIKDIDHWINKYPKDQKQSAVMSALMIVQDQQGCLSPESMDAVAEYLGMPKIAVYEVASFYSMYALTPTGRHSVDVCTNVSCLLRGSAAVVSHLEKKLGIKCGETTEDGRFTLKVVECLGACVHAPMMQVDRDYHEHLTPERIDAALEEYP